MSDVSIYVNKPYLPPIQEFNAYLNTIWDTRILTNNGPFLRDLENKLLNFLEIDNITLVNNGTSALISALEVLDINGEVITTPYSFIATANSILWKKCTPVFVDISDKDLNIDVYKIRAAITKNTSAILAVHCYGFPCAVDEISEIAKEFGLSVIYDAAHAFSVNYKNKSILKYGDASTLSFHATKVFSTVEGGAVVFKDKILAEGAKKFINFGFDAKGGINSFGINFKMNEMQSAMGLLQLKYINYIIERRRDIFLKYINELSQIDFFYFPEPRSGSSRNYSYFPIVINNFGPSCRDELYEFLKSSGIYARKYFYPLINKLAIYEKYSNLKLPIAQKMSDRVICIPIYPDLKEDEQRYIIDCIKVFFKMRLYE